MDETKLLKKSFCNWYFANIELKLFCKANNANMEDYEVHTSLYMEDRQVKGVSFITKKPKDIDLNFNIC